MTRWPLKTTFAILSLVASGIGCESSSPPSPSLEDRGLANAQAMLGGANLCEAGDIDACQRACRLNHSNSCARLGLAQGENAEGLASLERACQGGSGLGCEELARRTSNVERRNDLYQTARKYHRVHCSQGFAVSCSHLAALWSAGLGGKVELNTAQTFADRACALDSTLCPKERLHK